MNMPLYNSQILKLAASTATFLRLTDPHASAEKRAPLCGSRIIVDVRLNADQRIEQVGGDVRACALGQASAALMAAHAIGLRADDLDAAGASLAAFLAGTRDDPGDWPGLEIFAPVRPHTARHASIRLAFEAAAEATVRAAALWK